MDLALDAGVSARHVSFVESGRSRPSAEMVVRLAEQLEVPLRDRNELLLAAGYAPLYGERPLDDPEMTPVREALELVLRGHEPYPAAVVDRWWEMVAANSGDRAAHRRRGRRSCSPRRRTSCAWRCTPRGWRRGSSTSPSGAPTCSSACATRPRSPATRRWPRLRGGQRLPGPARRRRPPRRRGRGLRPARLPRRRRSRAALLQHGRDVRHRGRHHRGRARDRVVLPGGFGDGRGAARRLTASEGAAPPPRPAGGRRRCRPSPAPPPTPRAAPPARRRS